MQDLPFSQSCENNKDPILQELERLFTKQSHVLEIGSGTGQHCCYFSKHLSHLAWQPSDQMQYIPGLKARLALEKNVKLLPAITLDVREIPWPTFNYDTVFSANTVHIMSWESAVIMLKQIAEQLPESGIFALYGPFNYQGHYTSDSNAKFDVWLKHQNPQSAIRDFDDINTLLQARNLHLKEDIEMPANNKLLVWQKQTLNNKQKEY